MGDERTHLLVNSNSPNVQQTNIRVHSETTATCSRITRACSKAKMANYVLCCVKFLIIIAIKLHVLLISLLMDLPWKAAAFYSIDKDITKPKCLATCLQWIYGALKFILVIVAVITLGIVSFRRDYLDVYNNSSSARLIQLRPHRSLFFTYISPLYYNGTNMVTNSTQLQVMPEVDLKDSIYEPSLKLFGDVIILDVITIVLLFGVSLSKVCKKSKTRNRQALQMVEAGIGQRTDKDWDHPLIQLIDEINYMQSEDNELTSKICTILVTLIPIGYIVYSILVSVMYLYVYFKHTQVIWPADWEIIGCIKIIVIIILLVGTTAIDLVYIQIVMGYVLHCQLNIYFLQLIINKVENEVDRDEAYINQDEAMTDVKRAQKFLKQLNKSNKIVQLAIISAVIQAINCVIDLSNNMVASDESPKPTLKEAALLFRFLGWMFVIMAPFYQASQANETVETLCDSEFSGITDTDRELVRKNVSSITLNAELFNVTIHPGYIHLAIMVMLLIFAVKSGFRLFENMLLL